MSRYDIGVEMAAPLNLGGGGGGGGGGVVSKLWPPEEFKHKLKKWCKNGYVAQ